MANSRFFYGWVIAVCCTFITIINGGIFYTFSVFVVPVSLDFGWSRAEFSGAYTAMLVAHAPGAFLAGRLADRHGPRGILLLSALLIGLGFVGTSLAENLTLMTLCYVLVGLGLGATLAVPIATIQRWFVRWRGTMLGIVVAGPGIGGLIFPQLATYLITIYSWQTAYLTIAIIFGGVVAISSSFLASEPNAKKLRPFGDEKQHPEQGSHLQSVRSSVFISTQTFKSGAFWGMTAIGVLTFMPALFISAHLVPYAIDQGISAAVGARALGIIGVMTVIGRLVMTGVGGRIGWTKSLVICCATTSISVIGLIFVAAPWELFLFVVIYGFFWGSVVGLLSGAVGSFFGMATLSEVMGFLLGLSVLLGAAAPLLAGLSFDLTGSYFSAVVLSAISFAGAAIYSSLLKSPAR